jgi:signal transduction histidine kinase
LLEEQAALRRVASLVASGAGEPEIVSAVTSEVGRLFAADTANTLRWDGQTLQVVGDWHLNGRPGDAGRVFSFGGDTISARVIEAASPARVDSAADLTSRFARARWEQLGIGASIGAPIVVDGGIWGVVTASRSAGRDPFETAVENQLGDFAVLVAQAIANVEARREMAALLEEQSTLRRIATLVAGGRPPAEVLSEVTKDVGRLFDAHAVNIVRWDGVLDEVVVVSGWTAEGSEAPAEGDRLYPGPDSATIAVLETGLASLAGGTAPDGAAESVIAAPVIINASLRGALSAHRALDEPFRAGAEVRLRSFADLAAQSISNDRAQQELRASAARIVREGDAARQRLERNLHDGAQQRLVSVSISLRFALSRLATNPDRARELLETAAEELSHALQDLRDLARGLHPAILSDRGLGPALEALAGRTHVPVKIANRAEERLPQPVEAAAYYVVAESLTNVAKYAGASRVAVDVRCLDGVARVEVVDDGIGGATPSDGSGLRGLADRVEALGGRLEIHSPPAGGTSVRAFIPIEHARPRLAPWSSERASPESAARELL